MITSTATGRAEVLWRCRDTFREADANNYSHGIGQICKRLAQKLASDELDVLERLLKHPQDAKFVDFAASSGIPITATRLAGNSSRRAHPAASIDELIDRSFFGWCARVATMRSEADQAWDFLDGLLADSCAEPLRRIYASLLRLSISGGAEVTNKPLSDTLERPDVARAVASAIELLRRFGFEIGPLVDMVAAEQIFEKCASRVWIFALASRLIARVRCKNHSLSYASILSTCLRDSNLSTLTRLALSRSDAYICHNIKGTEKVHASS